MNKKIWSIILAVAGVIAAAGIVFALVSKKKQVTSGLNELTAPGRW